jgi:hypothetical protein
MRSSSKSRTAFNWLSNGRPTLLNFRRTAIKRGVASPQKSKLGVCDSKIGPPVRLIVKISEAVLAGFQIGDNLIENTGNGQK